MRATYLVFGAAGLRVRQLGRPHPPGPGPPRPGLVGARPGAARAGGRVGGVAAAVGVADRSVRLAAGRGDDGGRARRSPWSAWRSATWSGSVPVVVALFVFGFANGAWDVGMNVQGAAVERGLGRSIMSRFHAGWSLGTVVGALIGAAMVALDVPVTAHLIGAALVVALVVPLATRSFIADDHEPEPDDDGPPDEPLRDRRRVARAPDAPRRGVRPRLRVRRGSRQRLDQRRDDRRLRAGRTRSARSRFATFLAAMTAGRWFGTALLDRRGRVPVVRASAMVATVGVLVFAFGPDAWVAFVGVLLWGAGTALGFPVGMSAAADDPRRAAVRVSVVASIGYCAFLSGPPLIGFLAHRRQRAARAGGRRRPHGRRHGARRVRSPSG